MSERLLYTLLLAGVCLIVCIIIGCLVKRPVRKVIYILVAVVVFVVGSEIIDLNTLSDEIQQKVQQVSETVGNTYIKTEGNNVLILVNDEWLNLSDLSIIGDLSKDIVLEYEGKEIYVGHSGIYNTIKALEDTGLLK